LVWCLVFIVRGPSESVFGLFVEVCICYMSVCLGVPRIYDTLFLKSLNLTFLVLARILCVLNKFYFNFLKIFNAPYSLVLCTSFLFLTKIFCISINRSFNVVQFNLTILVLHLLSYTRSILKAKLFHI